ncbi:unnamed protein product [Owenia fusiformis]|uniref:Uncharacterized protein n=1 Tax=Owenia fusiformis TaxID=6347 RepID=A0A8J1U1I9_OWEFU|nr:unnamed protein product [Owenia fusiformis]
MDGAGRKKLNEIQDDSTLSTTFLMGHVIKLEETRQHTSNQGKNTQRATGYLADETGYKEIVFIGEKAINAAKVANRKQNTICLKIQDYGYSKSTIYASSLTNLQFMKQILTISPEMRQQILSRNLPGNIDSVIKIHSSPVKSRVDIKGKIVKVHSKSQRTIRSSQKTLDFREIVIKDKSSQKVKVSLWAERANLPFKTNDTLSLTKATVAEYNSTKYINTNNETDIKFLPDDEELSDAESTDEPLETPKLPQGTITSVSSVNIYYDLRCS